MPFLIISYPAFAFPLSAGDQSHLPSAFSCVYVSNCKCKCVHLRSQSVSVRVDWIHPHVFTLISECYPSYWIGINTKTLRSDKPRRDKPQNSTLKYHIFLPVLLGGSNEHESGMMHTSCSRYHTIPSFVRIFVQGREFAYGTKQK